MIYEKIQLDLAKTLIVADKEKRELLKILLSEIKLKKGNNPSDEDVISIILKFKTNAEECGNLYEIPILDQYLPQMMTKDEIEINVRTVINANNYNKPSDLGKVMKILNLYGPTLDKKIASELAKQMLSC